MLVGGDRQTEGRKHTHTRRYLLGEIYGFPISIDKNLPRIKSEEKEPPPSIDSGKRQPGDDKLQFVSTLKQYDSILFNFSPRSRISAMVSNQRWNNLLICAVQRTTWRRPILSIWQNFSSRAVYNLR